MSDVIEYKCPFCGGAMEFDSKSQHMQTACTGHFEMIAEEFPSAHRNPEVKNSSRKENNKKKLVLLKQRQWQKMRQIICVSIPASPAVVKL